MQTLRSLNLLVIGGGVFLGSAFVLAARTRGHQVTVFQRGQRSSEPLPGVQRIVGDRRTDISRAVGDWDAVIDTCGYLPGDVRQSVQALGKTCPYLFVSSISAFQHLPDFDMTEAAPLHQRDVSTETEVTGDNYGPLKAACEREVLAHAAKPLIVRPGLIVGDRDTSGRFGYWPWRVAQGGEFLAPVSPDLPAQCIDVQDLAEWMLRLVEQGTVGDFNAAGRADLTLGEILSAALRLTGSSAKVTWVSEAFLERHGVGAWVELPIWIPSSDLANKGMLRMDCSKARAHGLTLRPLDDTLHSTLAWMQSTAGKATLTRQLQPAREHELLVAWHAELANAGASPDALAAPAC